ncbi:h15 domain-containing protein [Caerostris darwini]|uniref:H15 domain-containing protein n=1 Tax=Caerostris darwini TaxID=1538125 RepID=A0AAV4UDT6_9ARAC|nr:h15 domain-containing protein [Caerostris darwini]
MNSKTQVPLRLDLNDSRNRIFAFALSRNESTVKKVKKAISAIDKDFKGASISGIVNWILSNYVILDPKKLKISVKKAVLKGLKDGTIKRSQGSKSAQGVIGSFTIPAKEVPKKVLKNPRKSLIPISIIKEDSFIEKSEKKSTNRKVSVIPKDNKVRTEKHLAKIQSRKIVGYV